MSTASKCCSISGVNEMVLKRRAKSEQICLDANYSLNTENNSCVSGPNLFTNKLVTKISQNKIMLAVVCHVLEVTKMGH